MEKEIIEILDSLKSQVEAFLEAIKEKQVVDGEVAAAAEFWVIKLKRVRMLVSSKKLA